LEIKYKENRKMKIGHVNDINTIEEIEQ